MKSFVYPVIPQPLVLVSRRVWLYYGVFLLNECFTDVLCYWNHPVKCLKQHGSAIKAKRMLKRLLNLRMMKYAMKLWQQRDKAFVIFLELVSKSQSVWTRGTRGGIDHFNCLKGPLLCQKRQELRPRPYVTQTPTRRKHKNCILETW